MEWILTILLDCQYVHPYKQL